MAVPPSAGRDELVVHQERPTHTSTWVVLILGFVGFVTSFGAHIVAVNLPVYAKQVGVGIAIIGLLIASYDFAEIIAKPLFGALADRWGMKQTMLAGIILFTVASLAYPWIDPRLLLFIRVLQGVGAAALSAVSLTLVGIYYADRLGRAYGLYNAIKGAGYVVSPVIGGAIVWKSNFGAIFLAAAVVGVIAFLAALWLPRPLTRLDASFDDDDGGFWLTGLRIALSQRVLWPWYLVTTINMFLVGILFGFLPVRVYALGYAPLITGLLLSAATTSYLLIQPVAGAIADRVDPSWTIRLGLALSGLNIILVPFVRGIPLVVVSVLAGIGIGTVWTNVDALVSSLADTPRLGATMGVAGSFKEFGDMLGPVLIGLVSQAFGLTTGFVACGVLGLISIGLIRGAATPKPRQLVV